MDHSGSDKTLQLRLGNLCYRVRDMGAMAAFYSEVLELPVSDEESQGEYIVGENWLMLQTSEQTALELLQEDSHTVPKRGGDSASNRLWPVLWVDDLDLAIEVLKKRGVEFTSSLIEETWGWYCFLRDP